MDLIAQQCAGPVLKQRIPRKDRPYGRTDFHPLDVSSSSPLSLGHKHIGKVVVDCKFLFTKSKWGTLGHGRYQKPAAILYMDLCFQQPKGFELDSAEVLITLDDEDKELYELHRRPTGRSSAHMTDWYGPKGFAGQESTKEHKSMWSLMPEAGVGLFSVGGMGYNKESISLAKSRWKFNGQLLPGKAGVYKTLRWELSGNDLEKQAHYNHNIHTAFAFEHNGESLLLRVEVKGKLKGIKNNIGNKVKEAFKFPSHATRGDASTTTLLDFGGHSNFRTPLDEYARSLQMDMYWENYNAVTIEMPDTMPIAFEDITSVNGSQPSAQTQTSPSRDRLSTLPTTPAISQPLLAEPSQYTLPAAGPSAPTITMLAEVHHKLIASSSLAAGQRSKEKPLNDTTRFDVIEDMTPAKVNDHVANTLQRTESVQHYSSNVAMAPVLRLSAVLMMQLASMLRACLGVFLQIISALRPSEKTHDGRRRQVAFDSADSSGKALKRAVTS
jgi:hypothetical protein